MLHSIASFIRHNEATSDQRVLMQLEDVRIAIHQVMEQLAANKGEQ
jgi:hypothetical protein